VKPFHHESKTKTMSLLNAFCRAMQGCGLVAVLIGGVCRQSMAETPHVLASGEHLPDQRLATLRNLDGDFPFTRVASVEQWQERAAR
jgi:hypothetical protein